MYNTIHSFFDSMGFLRHAMIDGQTHSVSCYELTVKLIVKL